MITIILCCYNSSARLPETLAHLAKQVLPLNFHWEIVLVDNASTDDTAAVAGKLWNEYLPGSTVLSVLYEPTPGQMHARIRGANAALYDTLIFCDDDNWLNPGYVYHAFETMQQHPEAGAAGGQNKPVTNAAAYPEWFDIYQDKYALGVPAGQSGDVTDRGFVLGAGMVTRRDLFLEMYNEKYPSLLRGRKGEQLSTGDDFEYCKRLLLRGYRLFYDQRLVLEHFIPKERLTIPYRDRLMQGISEAGIVLDEYDLAIRVHRRFKHKNRLRLLLLAPFRITLSRFGWLNRVPVDEELTSFYLSPFNPKKNIVRAKIKDFIYHR